MGVAPLRFAPDADRVDLHAADAAQAAAVAGGPVHEPEDPPFTVFEADVPDALWDTHVPWTERARRLAPHPAPPAPGRLHKVRSRPHPLRPAAPPVRHDATRPADAEPRKGGEAGPNLGPEASRAPRAETSGETPPSSPNRPLAVHAGASLALGAQVPTAASVLPTFKVWRPASGRPPAPRLAPPGSGADRMALSALALLLLLGCAANLRRARRWLRRHLPPKPSLALAPARLRLGRGPLPPPPPSRQRWV